jgi:hypothetical protein
MPHVRHPRRLHWIAPLSIVALTALPGGCARELAQTPNPIEIAAGEYDRVFDASIQTLRDMRFTVERKDRRFGVVTTEPLPAASAIEPWHADNTTSQQVAQSTLHFQRRIVRIELAPAAADARPDAYRMTVRVDVQRRYDAPKELNSAFIGAARFRDVRERNLAQRTETGLEESRWSPVGRDEQLEQRLIASILNLATRQPQPAEPAPATPAPNNPPAQPSTAPAP